MIRSVLFVSALGLAASCAVLAQGSQFSSSQIGGPQDAGAPPAAPVVQNPPSNDGPLSKFSLGVGISPLGIGMEATTNINQHFNVRGVGNVFNYTSNFDTNGFTINGKLDLASAGVMLDVYPFHTGFRLSPGVLFLNNNQVSASSVVAGGTSFTLNDQTYYSANKNSVTGATPVNGSFALQLNKTKPAFVATTGWGNHVQRNGHWSFPVEIGAAFVGKPAFGMNLAGWACTDAAQTHCANLADPTNPISVQVQSNLKTQIDKWNSDLEPLKTYPILSVGVAYSFRIRK